jgi:hypothetical protein
MAKSPSQSALNSAAAALRGIWAVLGLLAAEVDPWRVIDDWIHGVFRRLDALLLQFQAGQLAGCDGAGAEGYDRRSAVRALAPCVEGHARVGGIGRGVLVSQLDFAAVVADAMLDSQSRARPRGHARHPVPNPEIVRLTPPFGVVLAARMAWLAKLACRSGHLRLS